MTSAMGGPVSSGRPILVAGFGRFDLLLRNPATTLVKELGQDELVGAFSFMPAVPVNRFAPCRIADRARNEDARAIVVFGVASQPSPRLLRLEQISGKRVACRPYWRLRGVRRALRRTTTRAIDDRFLTAAAGLSGIELGDVGSSGRDICNWTLRKLLEQKEPPIALIHISLKKVDDRLVLSRTLLERFDTAFR